MTEEEQLEAVLFVGRLSGSERKALAMKAIQRKRNVLEAIMFIDRQEGVALWFSNPLRRTGTLPTTILMEDDGDIETLDDEQAEERIKGNNNLFSSTSGYDIVIGPSAGNAHEKMAYWKRQDQYAEAWAAFKKLMEGDAS